MHIAIDAPKYIHPHMLKWERYYINFAIPLPRAARKIYSITRLTIKTTLLHIIGVVTSVTIAYLIL